ncbi:hypothetical protein P43SY_003644 [Pythium insidiosum]|uniref:WW domain-containing protein n=1 Tax=Pythium insidiosum TaxID=114742 RepID=A0AAD5QD70_PYTIN|nr:hypothetical protein P43SY_003644 [Pythium insidiosum]
MFGFKIPGTTSNNNNNSNVTGTGNSIFNAIGFTVPTGTTSSLLSGHQDRSAAPTAGAAAASATTADGGSADDLPPGWRLVSSRHSGRDYYLHIATGHTQWDKPTEAEPKRDANSGMGGGPPKANNMGTVFSVARMASMLTQANNRFQTTLQATKVGMSATNSATRPPAARGHDVDRDGQVLVEVFENERLDGPLRATDPKKFSDRHAAAGSGHDDIPDGDLAEGHQWVTDWEIDQAYTAVDRGWGHENDHVGSESGTYPELDDDDDPFHRTAQKAQTGFRVNMKFPHRGGKDNTKDYQSLNLTDVMWLVNAADAVTAPTDEMMREKTANLENEEQRALNAEMAAANQALEEKAKALATARMRYKRDNKSLAQSLEDAKKRLEQQKAKAEMDAKDPLSTELKAEMEKVRQLHAKLEAVRQHRLALEEESKTLFNQVVEKKADLKFQSKKKLETALKDVDEKIQHLKDEQAALTKKLAQQPDGDELRQLNARRNDIPAV